MRGTVSKRLRRQVYGSDFSYRERSYRRENQANGVALVNSGRRAEYLKLKREYKGKT